MLREHNARTVFAAIRSGHPISRAEISRRVGISKPTASAALSDLLEAGLVREVPPEAGSRTYGALFFQPAPDAAYVLAVDIGARYLRGTIAGIDGSPVASGKVAMTGLDAADIVKRTAKLRDRLASAAGIKPDVLEAAVAGIPGVTDPTGRVRLAGLPSLDGYPLAAELSAALGLPVLVENDVNLAALGEQAAGAGRGVENFAFLSIGTGTGSGLVLRGELHRGSHGAAGEIDFAFGPDPDEAETDSTYVAPNDPCGPALVRIAEARLAAPPDRSAPPTTLRTPLTPEQIFTAARAGDPLGTALVRELSRRIAATAAPIAAVTDVELIVLGGGIGLNGDLLLDPVRAEIAKIVPYPPRLECSRIGDPVVQTGAVTLAARTALESVLDRRLGRP
jgi:predicted NBD/HSP70 family sugar kinase